MNVLEETTCLTLREVILMLIWKGKELAEKGTYWDTSTGDRITIEEQGILPGDRSKIYIKASSTTMLLMAPVLGLMFAIFLPFIGIAMTLSFLSKKIVNAGKRALQDMVSTGAKNMFFTWRPLHAYLAKRRQKKKETGKTKEPK